jgi:hypothetical protein
LYFSIHSNTKALLNSTTYEKCISIVDIPSGLSIINGPLGHTLVATKDFEPNETIYLNTASLVPDDETEHHFQVRFSDGSVDPQLYKATKINTVKLRDNRVLYTFDGFMNHSCIPNTRSESVNGSELTYHQIATKHISTGEEITCNYLLFDYDCDGHQFECKCGHEECYGLIRGFANLTLPQQVNLLQFVDPCIKQRWLSSNKNLKIFEDLLIPNYLYLSDAHGEVGLLSKRSFKKGEIVFRNKITKIEQSDITIVKLDNSYKVLNNLTHTINRVSHRLFIYFDTFMNHSCDPNTRTIFCDDSDTYNTVCIRDIGSDEELTCDYTTFDYYNDSELFECACSSTNCQNYI